MHTDACSRTETCPRQSACSAFAPALAQHGFQGLRARCAARCELLLFAADAHRRPARQGDLRRVGRTRADALSFW
eukprot:6212192-Pleurochrysis_carterae.AAC.2